MSKLNKKAAKGGAVASGKMGYSENGNLQSVQLPQNHLLQLLTNALYGNSTFYSNDDKRMEQLHTTIGNCVSINELDFVANAIVYARTTMNIRTMPIVATIIFAKILRDRAVSFPKMKYLVRDVIQRADQITEMLAYALQVFGDKKCIPRAVLKGIGLAFHKFDEYQFAKYKGNSKTVSMAIALRLTHPANATPSQGILFNKIINDTLAVPNTWETALSTNGQLGNEKRSNAEVWSELIKSNQLGYMALLRNLRNIEAADINDSLIREYIVPVISDPARVKKSGMLPFQFNRAMDSVHNPYIKAAIEAAVDVSVQNIPKLGNRVWIIMDESQSMKFPVRDSRGKELPTAAYIACHFVAALTKAHIGLEHLHITSFATAARTITVDAKESVYVTQKKLLTSVRGGGTALCTAMEQKPKLKFEPDTVILLSDMEVDNTQWDSVINVSNMFDPDCIKIAINLATGNTTPVGEKQGWFQLSGWSDNLFQMIINMRECGSVAKALSTPYQELPTKVTRVTESTLPTETPEVVSSDMVIKLI
jgi:hypothetical protein